MREEQVMGKGTGRWGRMVGGFIALGTAAAAVAGQINYTDWTVGTPGMPGSASGSIGAIGVRYTGEVAFAQVDGSGVNYWASSSPAPYFDGGYNAYDGVSNMPVDSDIIAIYGGSQIVNTITFSAPVEDPIMLVLSLGQPWNQYYVRYDFDQPFTILSSGNGYWGGDPAGSLWEEPNDVLVGYEGHGAIQFKGTVSSVSWTADPFENWHGFTVGVPSGVPEGLHTIGALLASVLALGAIRRLRV